MLIGLTGLSRSGKDSIAKILEEKYGYEWRSFAANLRSILLGINPVIPETGNHLRDEVEKWGWDRVKAVSPWATEYMISLGQGVRDLVHEDAWTWGPLLDVPENLVISDCRQPNEADKILALGGQLWKIERPQASQKRGMDGLLDHYAFDVTIWNTGTLADLEAVVDAIMER